jgi:hypothetical protein
MATNVTLRSSFDNTMESFIDRPGYLLAFCPSTLSNGTKREDDEWRILLPALASCLVREVPDDAAFALTLVVRN